MLPEPQAKRSPAVCTRAEELRTLRPKFRAHPPPRFGAGPQPGGWVGQVKGTGLGNNSAAVVESPAPFPPPSHCPHGGRGLRLRRLWRFGVQQIQREVGSQRGNLHLSTTCDVLPRKQFHWRLVDDTRNLSIHQLAPLKHWKHD